MIEVLKDLKFLKDLLENRQWEEVNKFLKEIQENINNQSEEMNKVIQDLKIEIQSMITTTELNSGNSGNRKFRNFKFRNEVEQEPQRLASPTEYRRWMRECGLKI